MTKKKKPEDLLKEGRKPLIGTKYTLEEVCARIISLMTDGASKVEVAASLDICRDTLHEWSKTYPEISDALKIASVKSQAWWEYAGRANLFTQGFNSALWYMNMKNRFGWTDRQAVENSGSITLKHEDALSELE